MRSFLRTNLKPENFFFFALVLLVFGFLFFPARADAWVTEAVVNTLLFIPTLLIGAVFFVAITLSGYGAWIAGALLDWVTGPNFISYSYTNPANNPVIANGLKITQSFVNMFLVVVLVYIAVSIALRLAGEGGAKKMLVRLILIALLVNFAPVFCGLVVDASNIVMNYFLVGVKEGVSGILTQALEYGKTVASSLFNFTGKLSEKPGILAQGLMQIILNNGIGLIFLLFAGLFILRYFALWILVILSPLAFVSIIIPKTKSLIWDKWLSQFISWSIIGIVAAFFLYLGMSTFGALRGELMAKIELPGLESTTATFMDNILPFAAVVIFLFLGFTMGLATSAMGTTAILSGFKRGYKAMGRTAARTGGEWMKAGAGALRQEAGRIRQTYQIQRTAFGDTRMGALGTALRGSWQQRIRPAITSSATYAAAGRGILSAARDISMSGIKAAFKGKVEKKVDCPSCGKTVPDAKFCNQCGAKLP